MVRKTDEYIKPELSEELESEFPEDTRLDSGEVAPETEAMDFDELDDDMSSDEEDLPPTGGDVDVDAYLAEVVGEEAIGGTTPTPDQNVVDEIAASAGISTHEDEILHTTEMLEYRNSRRWELDPKSSEDYGDRRDEEEEDLG
jgi:Family of unknown function (DUF6335)